MIDELTAQIDGDRERRVVRRHNPYPERVAAQVALGYFLPYPAAPEVDFDPSKLLCEEESLGWDLARARAHTSGNRASVGHPAEGSRLRFAVLQSELYRRHLRLVLERLDVRPLADYLKHLVLWYMEEERGEAVERVVHTLLDRSARGLGLEASR